MPGITRLIKTRRPQKSIKNLYYDESNFVMLFSLSLHHIFVWLHHTPLISNMKPKSTSLHGDSPVEVDWVILVDKCEAAPTPVGTEPPHQTIRTSHIYDTIYIARKASVGDSKLFPSHLPDASHFTTSVDVYPTNKNHLTLTNFNFNGKRGGKGNYYLKTLLLSCFWNMMRTGQGTKSI